MRSKSSEPGSGFSPEELDSVRPGRDLYVKRHLPARVELGLEPARYTAERRGGCTVIWLGGGEDRTTVAALRDP